MKQAAVLEQFVQDLRDARDRIASEHGLIGRARELAAALAARKREWLTDAMCVPDTEQGFGVHLLHEEPDHSLAAFVVTWLPKRGTAPHDHGTWAVVAGLDGRELNRMWRRRDDRSRPGYAELEQVAERAIGAGDIVAMTGGAIHSVWNDGEDLSVSLHVYGVHFNHTERSQFDPETRTEKPYKVRVTA